MGALKWYNPSTEKWEYVDQPGGANSWVFKEAISGVDGTETTFATARGYIPGTLQVFVNGIAQGPTHIVETSPNLGTFTLDVAPAGGDVVTVNYQMNIPPHGNADTLDGFHASATSQPNTIPVLNSEGALDVDGDIYSNGEKVAVEIHEERGWGFITGDGDESATKSVSFSTPFSSPPLVFISSLGFNSDGNPSSYTDFPTNPSINPWVIFARDVSTSGFTAQITRSSSIGTFRAGFVWWAIEQP